jgi:hypothetical protein
MGALVQLMMEIHLDVNVQQASLVPGVKLEFLIQLLLVRYNYISFPLLLMINFNY